MRTKTILLILILPFLNCCKNREVKNVLPEVCRVRVAELTTQQISIPVHSTGTLTSSEELKLSFKTGGIVAKINVKEGMRVRKGDLLASLNLSEVAANAGQAENGYEKALRDYTRAENLYNDSVATLEQKQNALTALNVAKSTLEIVQFNLSHSRIIAPDNGVILKQLVKQNELVSSGYPVFLFGTTGKSWKIKSGLSDKDVVKVNQGDSASISFDAWPGIKFSAVVEQIGEMSDPYTGTYEIELLLESTDYRLASGFIASVDIFPLLKKSLTMVPVGSIVEADGQHGYIYGLKSPVTVQKMKIEIETIIGSMAAVKGIPDGINEIVTEGAAYLWEGVKVEVVK